MSLSSPSYVWLICLLLQPLVLVGHGDGKVEASQCLCSNNADPYRTAYHFQPFKNWMNDPNGPMIYKGIYHLFYQYNPNGAVWVQNISWGHSASLDLVNWTPQPIAMSPSAPHDINGVWSGSATILPGGIPAMLYTGIDANSTQVQNLAMPNNLSDPYLTEWVKSPHNPLMSPTPANNIDGDLFRDPTTAWIGRDGEWRVLVGKEKNRTGAALLYTSKDFVHWTEAEQPLHSVQDTGMWECLDFFPVSTDNETGLDTSVTGPGGVKHVLKSSMFDVTHDYYTIGIYNTEEDVFTPDTDFQPDHSGLRLDYGKFYASKTFFDGSSKRRILWGWVNESTDATADIMRGWSGLQAVPRKVWIDRSGDQLVQWPIEEIERLRTDEVGFRNQLLGEGSVREVSGITGSQADIEISFSIRELENAEVMDPTWTNPQVLCSQKGPSIRGAIGPFGLLVMASKDMQEFTAVFFRVFKNNEDKYVVLMCSDQTRSSLVVEYDKINFGAFLNVDPVKEDVSLRCLIDHSIVESFGGKGKACITARVYPTMAIENEAHLYVFNNGTQSIKMSSLSAWSMKKADINRSNEVCWQ